MPLLKEQVEHIARLARLNLPHEGIEPRGKALDNAPDSDGGYFPVPRVIR